ncbi:hypothetical protein [Schleiferia thermophila]|jgi:hypothetical protein|uniref:hypothetical protein n=1 Tax=Schleiferia thermophila TaxID=884107 RepID=UPI003F50CAF6
MSLYDKIKYAESLFRSRKFKKKIVIIESDDWGSERIPNLSVRKILEEKGIDVGTNPHSKYDTLERLEDLELLHNQLEYFEKQIGKKVKITANFIVGNPDFEKIKQHNYQQYFFEEFTKTYERRDGHTLVWSKIQELIRNGYFVPQFHGREHINFFHWLKELRKGNKFFSDAFELGCYGIDIPRAGLHRKNLMAAFEYSDIYQKKIIEESISEGLEIFENYFKRKSETVVAPRHVWDSDLEYLMRNKGVTAIQTTMFQLSPGIDRYQRTFRYTGMLNPKTGMRYLVRNAFFEPSYSEKFDWINQTLRKVQIAFLFNIPAIIGMHRINFVGGLIPSVRDQNLEKFNKLLQKIVESYPDVEFLSSDELSKMIN